MGTSDGQGIQLLRLHVDLNEAGLYERYLEFCREAAARQGIEDVALLPNGARIDIATQLLQGRRRASG